jgi:two-component system, NtrC family, sensor histidine kinase HydH
VTKSFNKLVRSSASIWVVIGAIVVVAIIAVVMTLAHFQRQKEQAVELLVEKGATLIRSFEAGLRTPANIKDGAFGLQKLLMETAQQPDIDYIIVTNGSGKIIADSDPSSIGDEYGLDLDIKNIASSKNIQWRQVANPEGAGTFEVYRGFFPQERFAETKVSPINNSKAPYKNSMIIYVGFNMSAIEKADKEDTRNTIIIALVLLLIGSSAIVSLFLAQAYRLARTSLSRITVFSEALVKNMPIGLIALDENSRIATCNEKAGAILNIDCSAVLGQQAASIVPAPLRSILSELSQKDSLVEKYVQLIFEKDEHKTLEIVAAALSDKGRPAGRIMLLRDVTTIRELENEVAKSRHLTSIGSLAAGVAHEIRNPLSSIKGFAVYFKERLAGNEEDQKTADIMIQEVERLNRVISQLIEFARPLELKKEKVRFADLVSHTITLIAAEAQKDQIDIIVGSAANLPLVEADPDKVKQVLLNIFLNSLAAMKSGGKLSVNFSTDKDYIDVIITDTGLGIDQADLPRIYDPYFTSKPAGTGLGLAVVQKIMEAHGGVINVESAIGKGTKVILQFPFSVTNKEMKG